MRRMTRIGDPCEDGKSLEILLDFLLQIRIRLDLAKLPVLKLNPRISTSIVLRIPTPSRHEP
jgi:hypothetical protein